MNSKNHKIALVDDDPEFAERMESYYAARKMVIKRFEKPETLLTELRGLGNDPLPYDIVLTDLMMPEMNGIEFTQKLKALYPELPVIVMTGNSSVDSAIEAVEAGATDYIVKPPNFPHLTVVLQRTLHFANLAKENQVLRKTIQSASSWSNGLVAKSPAVQRAVDLAKRVAPSDATVLITGESGTGKEVFANLIHRSSKRADKSFIAINCSAIPDNLLESELFGHAKGAFTGAESARAGIFEEASSGTLFLDEIGDMSLHLQSKLLRVLQERKIKRLGENTFRDVDVRIIAATLRNLAEEVKAKRFREDLFYRLNVIPVRLPSLRERKDDILPLAKHFLEKFATRYEKNVRSFTREAAEFILGNNWKGNIRELENSIERAVVVAQGPLITVEDVRLDSSPMPQTTDLEPDHEALLDALDVAPDVNAGMEDGFSATAEGTAEDVPVGASAARPQPILDGEPVTLAEFELRYIQEVLERCDGVKEKAARILGIDRKTLYRKIQTQQQEQTTEGA